MKEHSARRVRALVQCNKHILCSLNIVNINVKIEIHYSRHCRSCYHISLDINHRSWHQNIVWWWAVWARQYCKHWHRALQAWSPHHQPPSHIHYCVRWVQPIAATCPLVVSWMQALPALGGNVGSWSHITDTTPTPASCPSTNSVTGTNIYFCFLADLGSCWQTTYILIIDTFDFILKIVFKWS